MDCSNVSDRGGRRCPATLFPSHLLSTHHIAKQLQTEEPEFFRFNSSQISTETFFHRISLMARGYTLGPSLAPCSVEASRVHDEAFIRAKSEILSFFFSVPKSSDNVSFLKLEKDLFGKSSGAVRCKSEASFIASLRSSRSGSLTPSFDELTLHRRFYWTSDTSSLSCHEECLLVWRLEPAAIPAMKVTTNSRQTLIVSLVSLNGLGPLLPWLLSGPTSSKPIYGLIDPTNCSHWPRSVSPFLLASGLILLTLRWCFYLKGLYVKPNLFVILISAYRDQLRLSRLFQLVIYIPDISFILIAYQPFKPRCVYFQHRTSLRSVMFQHPVLVGRRLLPSRVTTSYFLVGLMVSFEGLNLLKNFDYTHSLICFSSSRTVFEWYRQFSNWYTKAYPEESTHRISLTAGSYPGPSLASCPVVVSRTHGNSFFLVEIASIENFFRFGSSNMPPSLFSMMLCFYGLIYRRLISYLETTSMNWFCEYLLQILLVNSSITDFDENMFFLTLCLMPVRLEYMEFSATSQCQLIRTIHHFAELIANVAATLLDLASDLMLCSRLRVFWNMRSQFLCAISLYHYAITFVVSRLALAKTLSFVISSST